MKYRLTPDRLGGWVSLLLGIVAIAETIHLYQYSTNLLTGDHTFPGFIGILFAVGGLFLIFKRENVPDESNSPPGNARLQMILTIGILIVYCIAINYLGYLLSTLISFVLLLRLLGKYSWIFSIIFSGIATAILYYLFIVFLKTPLPAGILYF